MISFKLADATSEEMALRIEEVLWKHEYVEDWMDQCRNYSKGCPFHGDNEGCIHPDGDEHCPREKSWGVFCPLKDATFLQEASP